MQPPLILLVIDDNEDDRLLYRRVLKEAYGARMTVSEEATGERALEAIAATEPGCVLLDYSLPGRDGIEVLKRIRAQHRYLPIILLTGQGNEAVAVRSMKEGAQDYITKDGITAETLSRAVRSAIETGALRKRLDEQHAALELFTHALAHDLKEPVRAVRSFSRMIAESGMDRRSLDEYLGYISDAGDRMAMLIDTVMSYLQIGDPDESRHEAVNLDDALESAKADLFALLRERRTMVSAASLPIARGRRLQIVQVLRNLLSNAVSHSAHPVHIRIEAVPLGATLRVSVRDDGPGIAREYQEQIFEPFRRLNRVNEHGGLGLAICRKIVEAHGGRIGCESEPGFGSCFFFTLPASAAAVGIPMEPAAGIGKPARGGSVANLLLVDDRDDDISIARSILTGPHGMDCNFLVAHDGKEGLSKLRDQRRDNDPVDLVLLDINMPVMNGFEMLEELAEDPDLRRIPVVMCSGSTREKDMERARVLGAAGYLAKPPFLKDLEPVLATIPGLRLVRDAGGRTVLMRGG